jgi:hypothetical protein
VVSRALRSVVAVCFAVGWCGLFGAQACSKPYSCAAGDFMYKECARLTDAASCTQVHGCHTRKAGCVNGCDVGIGCDSSTTCNVTGGCTSLCAGAGVDDCNGLTTSLGAPGLALHECEWNTDGADGGASCQSVCSGLKSEKSCSEQSAAGCVWVVCEGTVKDDCSSYSGDDCPVSLGCDRTQAAVE